MAFERNFDHSSSANRSAAGSGFLVDLSTHSHLTVGLVLCIPTDQSIVWIRFVPPWASYQISHAGETIDGVNAEGGVLPSLVQMHFAANLLDDPVGLALVVHK